MQSTTWRESRLVLPALTVIGGTIGGFIIGFGIDRYEGWDPLLNLLPMLALLIGFNVLAAWTGIYPEVRAAHQNLIRPTLFFAVILGIATAATLTFRNQGWTYSIATGLVAAAGTAAFILLSGWLQLWVRSLRD